MKPKIILDCDPGHDDAVAILFAGKHCKVMGITTVSGNVPLDLTTRNALITTQILGLDIPVHVGANEALNAPPTHAPDIHGETGLGGPVLPTLEREVASRDAVRFIIETIRNETDIWLVAVGPLTNIALAIRQAPDIVQKVKGISIMGGSTSFGNRTPAAEFNILADPEAADIVFRSGAKLYMCGLNLTHQFAVREPDIEAVRAMNSKASTFVADMLEFFAHTYKERYFGTLEGPLHDPCAVMAVTHPDLLTFEERHVDVELKGEHTRGMTLVDMRRVKNNLVKNAHVAMSIERDKGMKLLLETIGSYN